MEIDRDAYRRLLPKLEVLQRKSLNKIISNGWISSNELEQLGYSRASKILADLKIIGVDLQATCGKAPDGSKITLYSLSSPSPSTKSME